MAKEIKQYIIGIIVFTLIIVGGVGMILEMKTFDPTFASDERFSKFNDTFNVYSEVTGEVEELSEGITNAEPEWGVFGGLYALTKLVWHSLTQIPTMFGFMIGVYGGISEIFGVPAWIPTLIISIISIIIVFAIFKIVFSTD